MRWPSHPLEIARRKKAEGFTSQASQMLEYWHKPVAVDRAEGS
jgi:hypothetical protein